MTRRVETKRIGISVKQDDAPSLLDIVGFAIEAAYRSGSTEGPDGWIIEGPGRVEQFDGVICFSLDLARIAPETTP